MKEIEEVSKKIINLIKTHPEYKPEAYSFILGALHFTVGKLKKPRHVTGQELADGIRLYALEQYGPMARSVFAYWGINETLDFGKIVFALIDVGLMRKTENDSVDDFKNCYDFKEAFDKKYEFQD